MNDRFLRACRCQPVDRTPLWIMRQAGRYLPEYRVVREKVDFLTLCKTPELAAEASLQPLRRFPLDAAIVFSDIMVPLEPMGVAMTFDPGPKLARPVRTRAEIEALRSPAMSEAVPFVGQAIAILRRELEGKTPVIGFCGAPWTLAAYLCEGRGSKDFGEVRTLLYQEPRSLKLLLEKLADAMADYLSFQIRSGAQAVQIFDSWAGLLSPSDFDEVVLPALRRMVAKVKAAHDVPVVYFATAAGHLLDRAATSGADVLGICWRTPIDDARRVTGGRVALQGNLDPHAMLAGPEAVRVRARQVLASANGAPGHIMNLGHGILPETSIASVHALVETVHGWSASRRGAAALATAPPADSGSHS
jgi:uroporphyrinogen decarboxylase